MNVLTITNTSLNQSYTTQNESESQTKVQTFPNAILKVSSSSTTEKKEMVTNSVGNVLRQMVIDGKESAKIVHKGVPMSFSVKENENGSYKFETVIGTETENTKWYSVSTKDGTVTFDLNNVSDIMKCLDMFSREDADKILQVIQAQRVANVIEDEIDSKLSAVINKMQDAIEDHTTADTEDDDQATQSSDEEPTDEQLDSLVADQVAEA